MSYTFNIIGYVAIEIYDSEDNLFDERIIDAEEFSLEESVSRTKIYKAFQQEFSLEFTFNFNEGASTFSPIEFEIYNDDYNITISKSTLNFDYNLTDDEY